MGSGVSNSVEERPKQEDRDGAADASQEQSPHHFSWLGSKRSSADHAELPAIVAFMQALPADSPAEDYIRMMRKRFAAPWETDALPPKEEDFNVDAKARPNLDTASGRVAGHYESFFDVENKGWALILEEKGQPRKQISGGYELPSDRLARETWFQSSWRPLLARCPAGTANPGGWVRAKHPLPRSGRHYWEVMFKAGKRKRGEPLGGIFMVGVVSNARENL